MASSPSTMIPAAGAKTSSTHRASFVHGTHRFHLDGYSLLKARDGTSNIISDEFEIAGHRWTMACCFKDHILERVSLRFLPPIQHPSGDGHLHHPASLRRAAGRHADWEQQAPDLLP